MRRWHEAFGENHPPERLRDAGHAGAAILDHVTAGRVGCGTIASRDAVIDRNLQPKPVHQGSHGAVV
jgi:hypothetical protein